MNITFSLDYEVFFGERTGSIENTLITPTDALCELAGRHSIPLVFFVDVGYLLKLREEAAKFPALMGDYDRIMSQLSKVVAAGHEIQLHVHSHWEDSKWNGTDWVINRQRYRLQSFSTDQIASIVLKYANALRDIAGVDSVFAFRAGGWLIQPFDRIRDALLNAGIVIDSTVFAGGLRLSESYGYDFRNSPIESHWFFDDDPLVSKVNGVFLEVPISSCHLAPLFYWQYVLVKKLGGGFYRPFGDGTTMPSSKRDIFRMLFSNTVSTVSIDGYKASVLQSAFKEYERSGKADFVIIGHPKSLTPHSLQEIDNFVSANRTHNFVGYRSYLDCFSSRH